MSPHCLHRILIIFFLIMITFNSSVRLPPLRWECLLVKCHMTRFDVFSYRRYIDSITFRIVPYVTVANHDPFYSTIIKFSSPNRRIIDERLASKSSKMLHTSMLSEHFVVGRFTWPQCGIPRSVPNICSSIEGFSPETLSQSCLYTKSPCHIA